MWFKPTHGTIFNKNRRQENENETNIDSSNSYADSKLCEHEQIGTRKSSAEEGHPHIII
jgi:hypothetical protein